MSTNSYLFSLDHKQNPVNTNGTDAWRITPETPLKAIARDSRYRLNQLEDLPANVKMFHPFFQGGNPEEAFFKAYEYFQGQLAHVNETGEIDLELNQDTGEYKVTFPGWEKPRVVESFESLIGLLTFGLTEAWTKYADNLEKEEKKAQKKKGRTVLSNDISEIGFLRLQGLI